MWGGYLLLRHQFFPLCLQLLRDNFLCLLLRDHSLRLLLLNHILCLLLFSNFLCLLLCRCLLLRVFLCSLIYFSLLLSCSLYLHCRLLLLLSCISRRLLFLLLPLRRSLLLLPLLYLGHLRCLICLFSCRRASSLLLNLDGGITTKVFVTRSVIVIGIRHVVWRPVWLFSQYILKATLWSQFAFILFSNTFIVLELLAFSAFLQLTRMFAPADGLLFERRRLVCRSLRLLCQSARHPCLRSRQR
mmetsp:Transcript_21350/g.34176  ORF Transcript_21350/g.34176 Transcript_21350/m.34176 type:complete len:244 (-) Transcript_21350:1552-2283(-)